MGWEPVAGGLSYKLITNKVIVLSSLGIETDRVLELLQFKVVRIYLVHPNDSFWFNKSLILICQ